MSGAEAGLPPPPTRSTGPAVGAKYHDLYTRVVAAIHALPNHFHTVLNIEGVVATDLFTLNTALGASIEQSMVECLNGLRDLWDPADEYPLYRFVRQAQTFPDVRLQTDEPTAADPIIFGIELKGWFTLAKEGEPSFRYKVTPDACAEMDLLVVVPWMFSNVISGTPVLLKPMIEEAKFAAEMRNYHWTHLRRTASRADAEVRMASHKTPYPSKASKSSDEAVSDAGKNFGRTARSRIFDKQVEEVMEQTAAGIPLKSWHQFLSMFREKANADSIHDDLVRMHDALRSQFHLSLEQEAQLRNAFNLISGVFDMAPGPGVTAARKVVTARCAK